MSFSNAGSGGVWFEGTGHMAVALFARNAASDQGIAATYLHSIALAQESAPHTDQKGIAAASCDNLQTGFGYSYFAAPHVGATSWYCIALQKGNPFQA